MKNKFNRQNSQFRTRGKDVTKSGKNSTEGQPTSKDIELATQAFLSKGGEIERVSLNSEIAQNEVFRANLEPDSRLGMGTLVDDSWDCWENKDYETNPSGAAV